MEFLQPYICIETFVSCVLANACVIGLMAICYKITNR